MVKRTGGIGFRFRVTQRDSEEMPDRKRDLINRAESLQPAGIQRRGVLAGYAVIQGEQVAVLIAEEHPFITEAVTQLIVDAGVCPPWFWGAYPQG